MTAITLHHILKFQRLASGWAPLIEPDIRALYVGARQFLRLQPLHFLLTRSHLAGARTRRKARDELVQLGDLFLALRIFASIRERICVFCITMSSYPPGYVMIVW